MISDEEAKVTLGRVTSLFPLVVDTQIYPVSATGFSSLSHFALGFGEARLEGFPLEYALGESVQRLGLGG